MKALVVDDSAAMRRMQQVALQKLGWDVHLVGSGVEALQALRSGPCDLVLTDWHMPEMDGLELVRAIRGDAVIAQVRIVMVTSDAALDSVQNALDAGVDDFLMKPFSVEALKERIDGVMGA